MGDHPNSRDGKAKTLSPLLPEDVERNAAALLEACCKAGLTLATAESCTGGLIASLLTDVEGASHAFDRAFVTYSKEAKCAMLGVRQEQLAEHGAVSEQIAEAMVRGALDYSNADVALAVTGYAGAAPDGQEDGLVYFACMRRGGPLRRHVSRFGAIGRGPVRIGSVRVALQMMREAVDQPRKIFALAQP